MTLSTELFERAKKRIPGGVNSPVRAFGAVGGAPVYIARGSGSRIFTVDGAELLDFCGAWGPLPLGHAHPKVIEAASQALRDGAGFGTNTPGEVELAEQLCDMIPYIDKVRLTCSGTEATMTALRLARAATGRRRILKFDGCYHGHVDALLVSAGSGLTTYDIFTSKGIPEPGATLVAPYNDLTAVHGVFDSYGPEIAAVIVEPLAANMGLVPPQPGFLAGLRELCRAHGALLIFDEVITGFRFAPTTYGQIVGVRPDISCLGKIIGGGMPVGALAGPATLMDMLAPMGPVYQAGTLSGNPVAVASGLATLRLLKTENPYGRMAELGRRLARSFDKAAATAEAPAHCAIEGGVFTPFFTRRRVTDHASARTADTALFARFFHGMLDRGIYLPPAQFEAGFVSAAHNDDDIDRFAGAVTAVLAEMARDAFE